MKTRWFPYLSGLILSLFLAFNAQAARINLLEVHSDKMNKNVNVVGITPDLMEKGQRCPVIYLLHGYSGDQYAWLRIKPELPRLADQYGIAFVCPDGKNSWYWDSPVDPSSCYETFVSKELVNYVDTHFNTLAQREGRAITGLSMGGHGALWIAIRHQDIFGACGSMSGGVDIRPFPDNWEMKAMLGELKDHPTRWDKHTVINLADQLEDGKLSIIFDCGCDDFFYHVNLNLHNKLLEKHIQHDFITRPGAHTNEYWNNSIDYQILFFNKFFKQNINNLIG